MTAPTTNLPTRDAQEVSAKNSVAPEPPLTNSEASPPNGPANNEPVPNEVVNNGADQNQE